MAYLHLNPQPYVASVHCGCGFNCIYTIIFYLRGWVVAHIAFVHYDSPVHFIYNYYLLFYCCWLHKKSPVWGILFFYLVL